MPKKGIDLAVGSLPVFNLWDLLQWKSKKLALTSGAGYLHVYLKH